MGHYRLATPKKARRRPWSVRSDRPLWSVERVDWARSADPLYHRALAAELRASGRVPLRSDDEAWELTRLVASMLPMCSPTTPRCFREAVLNVLLNTRRDVKTGALRLTHETPLDVVSSHSAYSYRLSTAVTVASAAVGRVSHGSPAAAASAA